VVKFKLIVGNPPYKRGTHLKVIDSALPALAYDGEIVVVHPAR